ncbi:amino acid kinase family protein [Streptomyces sp. NPDC003042]
MSTADVLKFGGSTFRTPDDYTAVAEVLNQRRRRTGRPLAVVVSAMPGETERLRERLVAAQPHPPEETVAGLLTLADTISAHLLAAALHHGGADATVLVGHQLGFTTTGSPMWAQLTAIDPAPLQKALNSHDIVVVPGGQAVDTAGRPSWLGKNSSDLSAVAVAVALGAATCEIHSDVDGVYSCDPHLVPGSALLTALTHARAAEFSRYGAKVLHRRAVSLAEEHGIRISCRSNRPPFTEGTVIGTDSAPTAMVVLNRMSRALLYDSHDQARAAADALTAGGVEVFTADTDEGPCVVISGGYVDLESDHWRTALGAGRPGGIPVVKVGPTDATVHLASGPDEAVQLARHLHDALSPILT